VPEFVAKIRFDQGVKNTIDYVLGHPECQTPYPEFDQWCDDVIEALQTAANAVKAASGARTASA
jgi:hypothetical protein